MSTELLTERRHEAQVHALFWREQYSTHKDALAMEAWRQAEWLFHRLDDEQSGKRRVVTQPSGRRVE